jgi:hypothetical protein
MINGRFWPLALLYWLASLSLAAQDMKYPALSEYMMPQDVEIALAKSAAPKSISGRATIKVLTTSGYRAVHEGDNGFACMVIRGFGAAPTFTPTSERTLVYDPKTRSPICFNLQATKTVLPYYELRTKLAMAGKTPDQITKRVQAAYKKGEIPKREGTTFAYMLSADQILGPFNHWHPHIMLFLPNYNDAMLGNNDPGGLLPFIGSDGGTPFAVTIIRVDDSLAIKADR